MRARAERVEDLIQQLDRVASPQVQSVARELIQTVTELHVAGLERVLEVLSESSCAALIDQLGADEIVGPLMALHGLHPLDLSERVARAIDNVGEALSKHGAGSRLLSVEEGHVCVRLQTSAHGCGSTAGIARALLEDAIYDAAPDVESLSVEEVSASSNDFVSLEALGLGTTG